MKNPKPYHYVRITKDAKADLLAWQIFSPSFMEGSHRDYLQTQPPLQVVQVFSSVNGSICLGLIHGNLKT